MVKKIENTVCVVLMLLFLLSVTISVISVLVILSPILFVVWLVNKYRRVGQCPAEKVS